MRQIIIPAIIFIFFIVSCREQYNPPVVSASQSFLVVEGNLSVTGPATVRLTRTFKLDATSRLEVVNGAVMTVEGRDNSIRPVPFTGDGYYTSPALNLLPDNEYRLRIKTPNGKEYLSDYVVAKITPSIDSISWEKTNEGVTIFANTKDLSNATKYYRWDYEETWEYHSVFFSDILNETDSTIRPRIFPQEDVSKCWTTRFSTGILLANSVRLQSDIISKAPVTFIPMGDAKLLVRYSILVKQYALEKNAYNFYELLKDNTEDIGSFFAPMPSEVKGNIYCVSNPDESVIGYITSSTVSEKRIFISNDEVRPWPVFNLSCDLTIVPYNRDSIRRAINIMGLLPVADLGSPPGEYMFSTPECIDCRVTGGITVKPSFW